MYSILIKKHRYLFKFILIFFGIQLAMVFSFSDIKAIIYLIVIQLIVGFIYWFRLNKYCKLEKLKNKIESSHNFTEYDVEQDFLNSINIGRIWIGNKFIVLLAKNDADLHINENLAWAFIFKKLFHSNSDTGTSRIETKYYLFTMDFDGNKNITSIDKYDDEILPILKVKCPNACIGYNNELMNIAFENINNIKYFDKSILDMYYIPTFNNTKIFLD